MKKGIIMCLKYCLFDDVAMECGILCILQLISLDSFLFYCGSVRNLLIQMLIAQKNFFAYGTLHVACPSNF